MRILNLMFLSLLLLLLAPAVLAKTHKYTCSEPVCVTKKHSIGAWHNRNYKLSCKYQPTANENTEQEEAGDTSDADTDDQTNSSDSTSTALYYKDWKKASGSSGSIYCTDYAKTDAYVKLVCFNSAFSKKNLVLQWTCSKDKSSPHGEPVE